MTAIFLGVRTSADPESFVKGWSEFDEGLEDPNTTINGSSSDH